MSSPSLHQIFSRLRRRVLWIEGVSGVGWGLAAGLVLLLAGVWVDLVFDLPPLVRIAAVAAALSAAVGFLIWRPASALRRNVPDFLARRLDSVAGTGGQIRSGVDLSSAAELSRHGRFAHANESPDWGQWSKNPVLTVGLGAMAVAQAATLAAGVPVRRAVPAAPIRRSFLTLASIVAVPGLLVLLTPRMASTEWSRFSDPFGDHPPYSRLTFDVNPQNARVVYGSDLDVYVEIDGPVVEQVELVLTPLTANGAQGKTNRRQDGDEGSQTDGTSGGEVLAMFPETDGRWRALISNITAPMQYHVRAGSARSRRFTADVITVPRFEDVRFKITSPPYTRLPDYEGPLPQGGLAGLRGTRVIVAATSNRPLSGGTMNVVSKEQERAVAMQPVAEGANDVTAEFEITASGRIDIRVTDEAGQPSIEQFTAPVTLLADERPFVRLLEPRALSLAAPNAVLPVVIAAEDDYGIARGQLFRSLNDSRYLPLELEIEDPPPARLYQVHRLPLLKYGLKPGDEIKLFARVEDNDPVGGLADSSTQDSRAGGKGAESSIVLIRIISQEDFERMQRTRDGMQLLMTKYRQVQRRMETLADELETLKKKLEQSPAESALSPEQRDELQRLKKRLQEEADALETLSKSTLPYELDRELSPRLKELADALAKMSGGMEGLLADEAATSGQANKQLQKMLSELRGRRGQFDSKAMMPLELLAAVYPLYQDQSRFIQLYQRQRDLAERLASLKGHDGEDDPALKTRMRDLEDEQRQLRESLAALLDDIEDHVMQLPDDERLDELHDSALEFVEAVRASEAADAMLAAEQALLDFSGTRGHAGAKKAADILESFIGKCEGIGQAAGRCLPRFQPSLGNCLSQTIDQLLADAGFGMGEGFGSGAGGGYSTRRSTLQNVGLYGASPQFADGGSEGTSIDPRLNAGDGTPSIRRIGNAQDPLPYEMPDAFRASGQGEALVPLRYRRKVGRYFQRIADEIGGP